MHQFGCGAGKHCALHSRQTAFGRIDSGCGGVENLTMAGRKDVARNKLNLPDYLPYLVNRVGAALVARFTADALEQHDLTIDRKSVVEGKRGDLGGRRIIKK